MRLFFICIIMSLAAIFQAEAAPVTLTEVIARTLEKSPEIGRVNYAYQNQLSQGTELNTWANPEAQIDILHQKSGNNNTDLSVELTQPMRLSQINGTRKLYSETLSRAASTSQKYELFKTINDVSTQYMKLWLLQEKRSLYTRSAKDAKNIAGVIQGSARQGQTAVSEATLFTADALRLETELSTIDAAIAQTKVDLSKLTGFSFADIDAVKPEFSKVPGTQQLSEFSNSRSNLRGVVRDNLAAAKQRIKLTDIDAFPEFGPRLLYDRGVNGGGDQAVGVGIAMRIPLWDTNQAERQRAKAALSAAEIDAQSVAVKEPQELIGQLQQSAARMQDRANKYSNSIVPMYRKSYELSRKMLSAGQIQALNLWQIREKLYQIEEATLQSTLDAYLTRLALELEIGGKLEEVQ